MDLSISLKQTVTISPQAIQNLEILQMGSQQLLEYIQKLAEENPTVELADSYIEQSGDRQFRLKLRWLREMDVQNKLYYKNDTDRSDPFAAVSTSGQTLTEYLIEQLGETALEVGEESAARFIISSLDENGWLSDSPEALANGSEFSPNQLKKAIALVQSLDPAGVGAADLCGCLLIQLRRLPADTALAQAVTENYLQDVAHRSVGKLAKNLDVSEQRIVEAIDLIRSLNPRPSSGFSAVDDTVYITPDVMVVSFPDHFELVTNDYYFPTVNVSSYYAKMLDATEDDEVKKYLSERLRQTSFVIRSIDQRKSMLLRCADEIVRRQEAFFRGNAQSVLPMTMAELAKALDVHESTVSRAVRDKYLQCSRGVFPLSRFFSRPLGMENQVSPEQAKELIRSLIAAEPQAKPLSDSQLCDAMLKKGVDISRRTVAKYRLELGIGSASVRRHERMSY